MFTGVMEVFIGVMEGCSVLLGVLWCLLGVFLKWEPVKNLRG